AWKLVLGIVFVLLVCFLRRGIIGGIADLYGWASGKRTAHPDPVEPAVATHMAAADEQKLAKAMRVREPAAAMPARHHGEEAHSGPILQARGLTKRYGGLLANSDIDFTVNRGELRGII